MEMEMEMAETYIPASDEEELNNLLMAALEEEDLRMGASSANSAMKERLVILGSGDMALALCLATLRSGLKPVVGSRFPNSARQRLKCADVTVTTVKEALTEGEMVLVAIPAEHHESLPRQLLEGKIVVDVSNRPPDSRPGPVSVAECLQGSLPESHVVKAFNTLSAFALQQGDVRGSREVPICGNSTHGRERVSALVKALGFTPVDRGVLENAREIEDIPFRLFPEWRTPCIVAAVSFCAFYLLLFFRRQLCPNIQSEEAWNWNRFQPLPLKNGMLAFALAGTVLLLMCYVPGTLAGYIQLRRGTKYSSFPSWLDRWLKGCMSIFTLMGSGMAQPTNWGQQLYLALGIVLTGVLAVLGVTSIPSVAATLTWREFTFLQRYLGWLSVLLVTLHAGIKGRKRLLHDRFMCYVIPHETQVIMTLCCLVILFKLPLLIPCVHSRLMKIRRGHERKSRRNYV
ncbi:metalloreductase STEAP3-like isoform X2 [Penaeus japonicus]|uniref:metalloreductase STEAP3-like isoform X2 n=1 Tax=Penaeus japonicus TaxID=27405 RepID=UPI001C712C9B|nr:metalloreductase STEAP3-like isoform X2 [Penaeus japonicus]